MSYKCWPNIWVYLLDKIKVEVGLLPSKKLFYLLQWKPSKDDEKWNLVSYYNIETNIFVRNHAEN